MPDGTAVQQHPAPTGGSDWHVLCSKPRSEAVAALHLRRQGFEVFLPRLRRSRPGPHGMVTRIEPLFPRYLFLRAAVDAPAWSAVRSTRGVQGLVRFGERLARMPQSLMQSLLEVRQGADDLIELPPLPLRPGGRVRVQDGPLAGLQGLCLERSGTQRVRILIELIGAQRAIELPVSAVRALRS